MHLETPSSSSKSPSGPGSKAPTPKSSGSRSDPEAPISKYPVVLIIPLTLETTVVVSTNSIGLTATPNTMMTTTIEREESSTSTAPLEESNSVTTPGNAVPAATTTTSTTSIVAGGMPVPPPAPLMLSGSNVDTVDTLAYAHTACNQDNVYRALLRYSVSANTFCPTYLSLLPVSLNPTSAPPLPLPNYIAPFSPLSISSACLCFEHRTSSGGAPTSILLSAIPSTIDNAAAGTTSILSTSSGSMLSTTSTAAPLSLEGGSGGTAKLVPAFVLVPLGMIIGVLIIICKFPQLLCCRCSSWYQYHCRRCCCNSCIEKKAEEGKCSPSGRGYVTSGNAEWMANTSRSWFPSRVRFWHPASRSDGNSWGLKELERVFGYGRNKSNKLGDAYDWSSDMSTDIGP